AGRASEALGPNFAPRSSIRSRPALPPPRGVSPHRSASRKLQAPPAQPVLKALPERQAAAQATREEERTGRPLGVRKVSASPAAGKEQILVEQDRKLADAAASPEASVRRAPAHRREEGGTPRTAEVSATASACGNGERRHRGKRREEAIARRQLQWILPPREELADFSSLPPERDLPA